MRIRVLRLRPTASVDISRTLCQMRAIVVRLDTSGFVGGVDVEGMQMRADLLDWREVLDHGRAGLEHTALCRARFAWIPTCLGDIP